MHLSCELLAQRTQLDLRRAAALGRDTCAHSLPALRASTRLASCSARAATFAEGTASAWPAD